MHIKRCLRGVLILVACATAILGQQQEWRRLLDASVAEQTAWITSDLDDGMQSNGDVLALLALKKSATTLPLIERKSSKCSAVPRHLSASPAAQWTLKGLLLLRRR